MKTEKPDIKLSGFSLIYRFFQPPRPVLVVVVVEPFGLVPVPPGLVAAFFVIVMVLLTLLDPVPAVITMVFLPGFKGAIHTRFPPERLKERVEPFTFTVTWLLVAFLIFALML